MQNAPNKPRDLGYRRSISLERKLDIYWSEPGYIHSFSERGLCDFPRTWNIIHKERSRSSSNHDVNSSRKNSCFLLSARQMLARRLLTEKDTTRTPYGYHTDTTRISHGHHRDTTGTPYKHTQTHTNTHTYTHARAQIYTPSVVMAPLAPFRAVEDDDASVTTTFTKTITDTITNIKSHYGSTTNCDTLGSAIENLGHSLTDMFERHHQEKLVAGNNWHSPTETDWISATWTRHQGIAAYIAIGVSLLFGLWQIMQVRSANRAAGTATVSATTPSLAWRIGRFFWRVKNWGSRTRNDFVQRHKGEDWKIATPLENAPQMSGALDPAGSPASSPSGALPRSARRQASLGVEIGGRALTASGSDVGPPGNVRCRQ